MRGRGLGVSICQVSPRSLETVSMRGARPSAGGQHERLSLARIDILFAALGLECPCSPRIGIECTMLAHAKYTDVLTSPEQASGTVDRAT